MFKFFSFIPLVYKVNFNKTLLLRAYEICSTFHNLHNKITFIKEMLLKNGYNINIIENTMHKFFVENFSPNKNITPSVPINKIYFKIPFYGIRENLTNIINNYFSQIKLCVFF